MGDVYNRKGRLMTDKEIIINGVDVSGCSLYKKGICLMGEAKCTTICDYGALDRREQLKRLEAENAKLKEEKSKYYQQTLDDEIKLNELYQCLQEIKKIAENRTYYIDFTRSKSYLELEQDYAKITNDLENRLFKILQKISEVEE